MFPPRNHAHFIKRINIVSDPRVLRARERGYNTRLCGLIECIGKNGSFMGLLTVSKESALTEAVHPALTLNAFDREVAGSFGLCKCTPRCFLGY